MSVFKRISNYFAYKRLQVHILTIFLSLISIASFFIISYTYNRNSKAILEFSKGTIDRVSSLIVEKISCLTEQAQRLPIIGANLFTGKDLSANNDQLVSFILDVVKLSPNLYAYYIGTETGYFVEIDNLKVSQQKHFLVDSSKRLPEGSVYGVRIVDRSQTPPTEVWTYKDSQFKTLATESLPKVNYDPRIRPWYIGAKEMRTLFGTGVYKYDPTDELGITIANPIFDLAGHVTAVVGADLTLNTLSNFLIQQEIGESGKAFVLSNEGDVILPNTEMANDLLSKEILETAFTKYNQYKTHDGTIRERHDFLIEVSKIPYLVSVQAFPITAEKEWLIAIYVPLNDFFGQILTTQKRVSYFSVLILLIAALLVVFFAKRISSPIVKLSAEVDKIKQLDFSSNERVRSNIKEIHRMDESIASMRVALRSFGRYVPKDIVKGLIENGQEIALEGEKKEITVFFSDIAGFTSIAETLPTEELMPLFAEYFDQLSKIILAHDGTIDKYIGDNIMAFWNAPHAVPKHESEACLTALLCKACVATLCQKWKQEGKPQFYTRFGLNTGKAIVGNIGTMDRMNYTAIGDVVNTAARLQVVDKEYHTTIIISDELQKKVAGEFLTRPLDDVLIRGKKDKMLIHELVAVLKGPQEVLATPEQIRLCQAFTEAYTAFHAGDVNKARPLFEAIHQQFPDDYPTQLYLQRLNGVEKKPIIEG